MTLPARNVGDPGHLADHAEIHKRLNASTVLDAARFPSLNAAVAEAEASGGPSAHVRLGSHHEVTETIRITRGITFQGGGARASRLIPTGTFPGPVIHIPDATRNSQWTTDSFGLTYDERADRSGPELKDFSIVPDRIDDVPLRHGIAVDRADDLLLSNIWLGNLSGTALAMGSAAPGVSTVRSARECELVRVKVHKCGSFGGPPAVVFQSSDTGALGDGSNQIYCSHLRFVYNRSGFVVRNANPDETLRRHIFSDSQFHGLDHDNTGNLMDHDMVTVSGKVNSVSFHRPVVNSGGPGLASFRIKADGVSGSRPTRVTIDGLDGSNNPGDLVAVDSCASLRLRMFVNVGDIDGALLRVADTADLGGFEVDINASSTPAGKVLIPATFASAGTARWNGRPLTLPY